MISFFDILAQNAPSIQTRSALVLVGLQNEFLAPNGLLASNASPNFVDRIAQLVSDFRPYGNLVWIRSEYDPAIQQTLEEVDEWNTITRPDIDTEHEHDAELFLDPGRPAPQACLKGSYGAEFPTEIQSLIRPHDMQRVKNQYSAFTHSNLLTELRCRLITKLYVCGALSNISVYATAIDAARSGMKVVLLEDCLAFRHLDRHERAIRQLGRASAARVMSSSQAIHLLRHPEEDVAADEPDEDDYSETESYSEEGEELTARLAALEVDNEASEDEMALPALPPFMLTGARRDLSELLAKHAQLQLANEASTQLPSTSRHVYNNATFQHTQNESPGKNIHHCEPIPRSCLDKTSIANAEREAMAESIQQDAQMARRSLPLFGEIKMAESNGSSMTYNLLDDNDFSATAFEDISTEVQWERMLHQTGEVPRLVCCQGTIADDGSMPVYRHPSDKTILAQPWTSNIDRIRLEAQKVVGHELNHGLIQLYRSGNDFISEHSDKTLDIVPGSKIVNVSLGAERTMRLRSKRTTDSTAGQPRTTYRVRMPHNSMIAMTLETNALYLHGINADKRPRVELSEDELAFEGARISITFRQIGTFVDASSALIWGQGAIGKTRADARPTITADKEESDRLILAFGQENQSSAVDWHRWYGDGSNVLHLR